jgi:hypothetical protein
VPTAQILVRQANGQQIVLSGDDRIVKEITVECQSPRCPSRHGQEKPVEFTFNDQDPFPAAGDNFMSLILPERSPSNPGFPLPFCSGQCLKDYLTYAYLTPGPRIPLTVATAGEQKHELVLEDGDKIPVSDEVFNLVRKTDNLSESTCGNYKEYVGDGIGCDQESNHEGDCGKKDGGPLPEPTVIGQADGVGE